MVMVEEGTGWIYSVYLKDTFMIGLKYAWGQASRMVPKYLGYAACGVLFS